MTTEREYTDVPVIIDEDITIYISVLQESGEQDVSITDYDFMEIKKQINVFAKEIFSSIKDVGQTKTIIEFGVNAAIKTGKLTALFAEAQGSTNFKITLHWDKPNPSK